MIQVESYDPLTYEVILISDAENLADQMTELRAPGVESYATKYADEHGIRVDGLQTPSSRSIRLYDRKTGKEVPGTSEQAQILDMQKRLIMRRSVKLAVSGSGESTLLRMREANNELVSQKPQDRRVPSLK